jgi:electron transport complex protein RnfC
MMLMYLFNGTRTFPKGGVHPKENKLTSGRPIEEIPMPDTLIIPVSQHIGAPSVPTVERGQVVKAGQLIAKAGGFVSANIHAPASGKVTKISESMDTSGYRRMAIFIKPDKEQVWEDGIDLSSTLVPDIKNTREEILHKILQAGLVGMGGAAFPTHIKLNVPKGKTANLLIINGVECEPYLTSDHRIMLEKTGEILVGVRLLMIALGVKKAVIGIENNKQDAIRKFRELTSALPDIEVATLKIQYPQGGEKQLIKAITGREVPSGGLPVDVGCVVHNVGTTFAAYEAVQKNKPLVDRVVTVTGMSLKNPGNFRVKVGTSVSKLIDAAGGLPEDAGKVISGGPMMGKALNDLEVPVTKGTSGILVLPDTQSKRPKSKVCIRCTKCVTACPMGLEPYMLMTLAEKELFDSVESGRVMDCIECGSCSYICPSNRKLLDFIRLGKYMVGKKIRERNKV